MFKFTKLVIITKLKLADNAIENFKNKFKKSRNLNQITELMEF